MPCFRYLTAVPFFFFSLSLPSPLLEHVHALIITLLLLSSDTEKQKTDRQTDRQTRQNGKREKKRKKKTRTVLCGLKPALMTMRLAIALIMLTENRKSIVQHS
ncbi:hypothetical protein BC940DRAFT_310260 [Gongronella butleri]|nr:hypothetical protein BC940DRAFT_310260 [Gongronella butleri]